MSATAPAIVDTARERRIVAAVGADVSVLVFSGLAVTLLAAMVLPAPTRTAGESAILVALLVAAGLATVLTGAVALLDLPTQSAVCGVIAWLLVVQCIWLAHAAGTQDEWDEEEDDDGGGSPGPSWPSAPPAPDDDGLPGLHAPDSVPAHAASAPAQSLPAPAQSLPAPAHSFPLVAAAPSTAEPAVPAATAEPRAEVQEAAHRRRLRRAPRRLRGEHRTVVHVRGACERAGRRRRASLRRRFLHSCRRLLWPEPPRYTATPPSFAAPEHEGRRHTPPDRSEAGPRSAVL
jgi:hypothetical protein